jgi:glycosyltransferase involved in cell wall biosynthesis
MKILWLSNAILSPDDIGTTGTWLGAMAQRLVASGNLTLGNISTGKVSRLTRQDCGTIKQWVVPASVPSARDGLPSQKTVADILKTVNEFSPDLVHVWGTELFWGLLTARKLIEQPALLEIQGIKSAYARVFAGGLSLREQFACVGLKELIRRSTIPQGRKSFEQWTRFEREIIAGHKFISTQSAWVEAWVKVSNASALIFHTELVLRKPFYSAKKWRQQSAPVIFYSAAYPAPYKGLHDAIRALAILNGRFPNARLHIAGLHQFQGIRQNGYIAWINKMAVSLHIAEQIDWLGPLLATVIVEELQNCSVMLMPSHCETYCLAFAEALYLGVPTVSAHTGGTDWLARDNESALFYMPGDEVMCAYQLERLLTDSDLANRLSRNARAVALKRNDPAKIVANQMKIYRQVIAVGNGGR